MTAVLVLVGGFVVSRSGSEVVSASSTNEASPASESGPPPEAIAEIDTAAEPSTDTAAFELANG